MPACSSTAGASRRRRRDGSCGSVAAIRQDSDRLQADYFRGDLGPIFSAPFSPRPWLDINPQVALRSTFWSKQQILPAVTNDPVTVVDSALWRNLLSAGVDIRGPKLVRIFERKPKPAKEGEPPNPVLKVKNTIEPSILYTYQQAYDRTNNIIVYDEVDNFGGNANALTYGLATRVIAQRPRASGSRRRISVKSARM
jgi:hypothetical protein